MYPLTGSLARSRRRNLKTLVDVLGRLRPTVVALQEVCVGRSYDQARLIADDAARRFGLRYHARRGRATSKLVCSDPGQYRGRLARGGKPGAYGEAVLSLNPPTNLRRLRLAGGETREVMAVTTQVGGRAVRVVNTHTGLGPREGARQIPRVVGFALRSRLPVVLLGDFNAPGNPPHRDPHLDPITGSPPALDGPFDDVGPLGQVTYPFCARIDRRKQCKLRLDYAFLRGLSLRRAAVIKNLRASDHRPVVAQLG